MVSSKLSTKYIFNKIILGVYNTIMVKLTLDKALEKFNVSRYELAKRTGIQYQIIDNYYKNKVIRYDSYLLDKICDALNCDIGDIIEYKK